MTTIQSLVKGCVAQDIKYQQLFYERYYRYVFRITFRYISSYDSVVKVVNDSFIKLFHVIKSFNEASTDDEPLLLTWIKKNVVTVIINELLRKNLIGNFAVNQSNGWETIVQNKNATKNPSPKQLILYLKSLPSSQNVVFNMYVIDGFSHEEISAQLHITVGASKNYLVKARDCLRKLVTKESAYSIVLSL